MSRTTRSSITVSSATRGPTQRGQHGEHVVHVVAPHVHLEPDPAVSLERAVEQKGYVLELLTLPRVFPGHFVGEQQVLDLEHGVDHAQMIGAQRAPGLGDLDDRVGQIGRFDLRGSPGELNLDRHVALVEERPRDVDELGGDSLAGEVLDPLEGGVGRHGQDPLARPTGLLGVDELRDRHQVGAAVQVPVVAGDSGVEHALGDVARDLLRPDQHRGDLGVVDRGVVGTPRDRHVVASALEQAHGRLLEASLG